MATGKFPLLANTWGHRYLLLNREPTSLKYGEVVGSDGVGWDPDGNGRGLFFYDGTDFFRLNTVATTISVDGGPASEGAYNLVSGVGIKITQAGSDVYVHSTARQNILANASGTVTSGNTPVVIADVADVAALANQALVTDFDLIIENTGANPIDFRVIGTGVIPPSSDTFRLMYHELGAPAGYFTDSGAFITLAAATTYRIVGKSIIRNGGAANELTATFRLSRNTGDSSYAITDFVIGYALAAVSGISG